MPTPNAIAAKWQAKLNEFDGYIVVTAEYNRSVPGALKNAIDWAYKPFIRKAVAYVSYGSVGGARAVEHLRTIMIELQAVPVRHGVHIGGSEFAAGVRWARKNGTRCSPASCPCDQGSARQSRLVDQRHQGRPRGRPGRRQGLLKLIHTFGAHLLLSPNEGSAERAAFLVAVDAVG